MPCGHHDVKEIVAKFADALEQFDLIDGQPSDTDLTRIQELLEKLLLQISYDKTKGTHNRIGLIQPVAAYTMRYGADFSKPACVGAYGVTIDNYAITFVRARTEAAHKAKRNDHSTYKTVRHKTAQFILDVIKDTWVR